MTTSSRQAWPQPAQLLPAERPRASPGDVNVVGVGERLSLLDREVTVLAERLRTWSQSRWRVEGRADAAFALATLFAELGHAPVPLPRLDDHVLADQIALTGHDLVIA